MKTALALTVMLTSSAFAASSAHEFTLPSIDGAAAPLSAYKGKVALLVNVASRCGYTPQYEGLQALYEKYKGKGFVILGFPANNFGAQEPGSNAEIKAFCNSKYSVTFPMYGKVSVKGADQTPLYKFLADATGGDIKWNFTKILIDGDGKVLGRFEPGVEPGSPEIAAAVEKALKK